MIGLGLNECNLSRFFLPEEPNPPVKRN
jgi:hypothetical protein